MSSGKNSPSKPKVAEQHRVVAATYSGPLPPPNILEGYDDICPGAAQTIISTYIQEVNHRQEMEKKMVEIEAKSQRDNASITKAGQWLGFVICLSFLVCGTYLVATGHQVPGALFGGGSIAAIVAAFLYSRHHNTNGK